MSKILNIYDKNEDKIIGIDFGTTNSLVAYANEEECYIIKDASGRGIISSEVAFEDGVAIVSPQIKTNENLLIKSIKRLLGRSYQDIINNEFTPTYLKTICFEEHSQIKLKINNNILTTIEIATLVFKRLKLQAEQHFNHNITRAVLTVPAYFNDIEKNAVISSARLAGLEIIRLLPEPTAAGYAYQLNKKFNIGKTLMVFDLGGGTFDVSIIKMDDNIFRVLGVDGDPNLGGDDIDYAIAKHIFKDKKTIEKIDLELASRLKEQLTSKEIAEIEHYKLDVNTLEYLTKQFIDKTIKISKNLIIQVGEKIEGIILSGGSTKLRSVTKALTKEFNIPIYNHIPQEEVVAIGAARYGYNLSIPKKNKKDLLIDVTPLSLGIEMMGGVVERIIPRNTAIPTMAVREFTTAAENQTAIYFHIVQGERELVGDCQSLAQFEIPVVPLPPGAVKVTVHFFLDENGILSVHAYDSNYKTSKKLEINAYGALSKSDVDNMLEEAMKYAQIDHKKRALIESMNHAKFIINNLTNIINSLNKNSKDYDKISNTIPYLEENISLLNQAINNKDQKEITRLTEIIQNHSNDIVTLHFNNSVRNSLIGLDIKKL